MGDDQRLRIFVGSDIIRDVMTVEIQESGKTVIEGTIGYPATEPGLSGRTVSFCSRDSNIEYSLEEFEKALLYFIDEMKKTTNHPLAGKNVEGKVRGCEI
jgi:hypothetical protein